MCGETVKWPEEWTAPALAGGGGGAGPPQEKIPLNRAVARVFPSVSLTMSPLKLPLASYLLDSGAGTGNGRSPRSSHFPINAILNSVQIAEQ